MLLVLTANQTKRSFVFFIPFFFLSENNTRPAMARKNASSSSFEKGSEVEVTSPNPTLRGTLFPAKIVSQPSKKRRACLVEYANLVTTNTGVDRPPKRLREYLSPALIRPSQPEDDRRIRRFELDDTVDAFVNGAWWEGTVMEEVKGGAAYLVYFKTVGRQFGFAAEELRLHREWIDHRWVPPLDGQDLDTAEAEEEEEPASVSGGTSENNQSQTPKSKNPFCRGALVEVQTDEDGLKGSWYSAKILNEAGDGKFVIEYQTLKAENESSNLVEEVSADQLRPRPPEAFAMDKYMKGARVDAYFNDGWWEGKVVKVLDRLKYEVHFQDGDEMVIHHALLRPHQGWSDGEWIM